MIAASVKLDNSTTAKAALPRLLPCCIENLLESNVLGAIPIVYATLTDGAGKRAASRAGCLLFVDIFRTYERGAPWLVTVNPIGRAELEALHLKSLRKILTQMQAC